MDPQDRLLQHLVTAARTARGTRKPYEVAAAGGIHPNTVRNFEQQRGWPTTLDELIYGYARISNREPIDIWQTALDGWAAFIDRDDATTNDGPMAPRPHGPMP